VHHSPDPPFLGLGSSRIAKYNHRRRYFAGAPIMRVISKSAWRDAVAADPSLGGPISQWYKVASLALWRTLVDVRKVYPHAVFFDPYTVFNIKETRTVS
jgi:hypothetical protein